MLPGPTILSTRRIVAVPYASAATACAPPTRQPSVTPAIRAAASTAGSARHVDPHPVERPDLLAEDGPVLVGHAPRLRRRGGVVALDTLGRVRERGAGLGGGS